MESMNRRGFIKGATVGAVVIPTLSFLPKGFVEALEAGDAASMFKSIPECADLSDDFFNYLKKPTSMKLVIPYERTSHGHFWINKNYEQEGNSVNRICSLLCRSRKCKTLCANDIHVLQTDSELQNILFEYLVREMNDWATKDKYMKYFINSIKVTPELYDPKTGKPLAIRGVIIRYACFTKEYLRANGVQVVI